VVALPQTSSAAVPVETNRVEDEITSLADEIRKMAEDPVPAVARTWGVAKKSAVSAKVTDPGERIYPFGKDRNLRSHASRLFQVPNQKLQILGLDGTF
jgi:hypothetical protein